MLLSRITTDHSRFQFRSKPYSETTVAGIVTEGIDLAKFDAIPILMRDGAAVVGGDGHSRFEAIRQLAAQGRLPDAWRAGDEWDIPIRDVDAAEAKRLSWTANLSRDAYAPMEEARVYKAMMSDGLGIADIAKLAHKDPVTIRRTLSLNMLAACIQERIGKPADAGGIGKDMAATMAELFARYNIGAPQQQEFFNQYFAHGELTPTYVRSIVRNIAAQMANMASGSESMLFAPRQSVREAAKEMAARAKFLEKAERSLSGLLCCLDSGVLDAFPQLKSLLSRDGQAMLAQIQYEADADGSSVGKLAMVA
jgi:hypothetical protein